LIQMFGAQFSQRP